MSNEVKLKARIQNKYETLENWNKLIKDDFIPLKGEVCYAVDNNKLYQKVGDGETDFLDLPWLLNQGDWNEENELSPEYIKNKPMKVITEPTHIAELDVGIYLINGNNGKVIIENINNQTEAKEDYCYIESGTLSVLYKTMEEENGALIGTIIYNASGIIISEPYIFQNEVGIDENGLIIHNELLAIDNPSTINLGVVSIFKILDESQIVEGEEDLEINTWYGYNSSFKFSDIPAAAIETDLNYSTTHTTIPTSSAVRNYIKEQNPIKEITTTVHVADLEPGIYYVNQEFIIPGSTGEIILANIDKKNNKIVEDYLSLKMGYIVVTNRYTEVTEEEEICGYSYIAHGLIAAPDYYDSSWLEFSYLTGGASEINCIMGYAVKALQESALDSAIVEGIELNKWYSGLEGLIRSNLTTSDLQDYFQQGDIYGVPTTKGVYDFAVRNQADYKDQEKDRPGYIKNKPFYTEYIPQGEKEVLTDNLYFGSYGQECPMNRNKSTYPLSISDRYNLIVSGTWELEDAPYYEYEYRRLEPKFDETSGGYLIGNASLYSSNYEDTGEHVCLLLTQTEDDIYYTPYWSFDHGWGSLERLAPEEEIIHRIDQKYLPYYSEYEEQRYILEPVTLDCQTTATSAGYTVYVNQGQTEGVPAEEFLSLLIEGQKYKVNYDGKYYICETYVDIDNFGDNTILFGNEKLLGNEEYTGDEPFGLLLSIAGDDDGFRIGYQLAALEQGNHTISIEYIEKSVPIFKTDSLSFIANENVSISPEIDLSNVYTNVWSFISLSNMIYHRMECKVTLNGEEYIANWKTIDDSSSYFLGNLSLMNNTVYKDTKENFLIVFQGDYMRIGTTLPAGTYDYSIEINGYPKREIDVKKIPNKYIDIDVPYTTDGETTTFNTDIRFQTRGIIGDEPTMDLVTTLQRLWDEVDGKPHLRYGGEYYEVGNYSIGEHAQAWSTGALPNGYQSWTEGNSTRDRLRETMYLRSAALAIEEINDGKSTTEKHYLEILLYDGYIDRYLDEINNGVRQLLHLNFTDDINTYYLVKPISAYLTDPTTLRIEFTFPFSDSDKFSVTLDQNGREIKSIQFLGYYGRYAHSQNDGYAMGENSSAEGCETIALGENQHVQGCYNELDGEGKFAHIVGNGSGLDSRSNAYTLDWEGNGNYSGTVTAKKFIAEEEEAFGKFTDSYFVLNDIGNGLNYAIQMKNGEIVSTELPVRIQVKQNPTKTNYYFGEAFDDTGMIIEAIYNNGTTKLVEDFSTNYDDKTLESTGYVQITVKAKLPSVFTTTLTVYVSEFDDTDILQDFVYSQPGNYEFQLQDWKQTYNGVSSTELIVPDYSVIVV